MEDPGMRARRSCARVACAHVHRGTVAQMGGFAMMTTFMIVLAADYDDLVSDVRARHRCVLSGDSGTCD